MAREAKYKVGDTVVFEIDYGKFVGVIKDVRVYPMGYPSYLIYDLWVSEVDIIRKEE